MLNKTKPWREPHPISRAEIDRFSKVVPLVEASMIRSWESHHNLSCTLVSSHNLPSNNNKALSHSTAVNITINTEK